MVGLEVGAALRVGAGDVVGGLVGDRDGPAVGAPVTGAFVGSPVTGAIVGSRVMGALVAGALVAGVLVGSSSPFATGMGVDGARFGALVGDLVSAIAGEVVGRTGMTGALVGGDVETTGDMVGTSWARQVS